MSKYPNVPDWVFKDRAAASTAADPEPPDCCNPQMYDGRHHRDCPVGAQGRLSSLLDVLADALATVFADLDGTPGPNFGSYWHDRAEAVAARLGSGPSLDVALDWLDRYYRHLDHDWQEVFRESHQELIARLGVAPEPEGSPDAD